MKEEKKQKLKDHGVYNRHAEKVTSPLFQSGDFFDPNDLAQVKYEMVRQVTHEGKSVSESAKSFGMSRPTLYQAMETLKKEGFLGLAPQKTGPRGRHKLNDEVIAYLREEVDESGSLNSKQLAEMVKEEFSISVHPRSIERALGSQKKISEL